MQYIAKYGVVFNQSIQPNITKTFKNLCSP